MPDCLVTIPESLVTIDRNTQLDECMRQIDAYIRWYNEKRIKLSLGRRSPVEYRQAMGLMN